MKGRGANDAGGVGRDPTSAAGGPSAEAGASGEAGGSAEVGAPGAGGTSSAEACAAAAEASAAAAAESAAAAEARATQAAAFALHPVRRAPGSSGTQPRWDELMSPAGSSPDIPSWLGKRIGRFRLLSLLGQGAMGRVFRAEDALLHRHVAIKVLPAHTPEGEDQSVAVERLVREARAAASLEHPHIVQVFEVNEAGGIFYIAMELAEGGSLKDLVSGSGPLAPVTACQLAAEAAEALAHAHARGVVHRDVKPANLMLTRSGRCKVADFGLARVDDARDRTALFGETVGTPGFVAPEVLKGDAATARSDVYGLGATLFYLLTGRPPFEGDTAGEVVREVLHAPVPELRRLRPELSDRLVQTVTRALSRDPQRRFDSCDQFAKVLRVHTVPTVDPADGARSGGSSRLAGLSPTRASASGSSGGLAGLADLVAGASAGPRVAIDDERTAPQTPRTRFRRTAVLVGLVFLLSGAAAVALLSRGTWWNRGSGGTQASRAPAPSQPATATAAQPPAPAATATPPGVPSTQPTLAAGTQRASASRPSTSRPVSSPTAPARPAEVDLLGAMLRAGQPGSEWFREPSGNGSDARWEGGKLLLIGTGRDKGRMCLVSRPSTDFNLFSAAVTVKAAGIKFSGVGIAPADQVLRVEFCSEPKFGYQARDAIGLKISANGLIQLGFKQGNPREGVETMRRVLKAAVRSPVTGFTLTLDPQAYQLDVTHAGQAIPTRFSGKLVSTDGHKLDQAQWFAPAAGIAVSEGKCSLSVAAQHMGASMEDSVTIEIGSLKASWPAATRPVSKPAAKATDAGKGA